jgi:NADH dehydrogenase
MARISPALPLIGGGKTKFQPVFAGDVGEAIARAVEGKARSGTIYELGGPEVLTFRQLMERMLEITRRKRLLLPVPWPIARIMGRVGEFMPGQPLTRDQVRMLRFDNVVSEDAKRDGRTLQGLGIEATALEVVLPTYLRRFRQHGEFTQVRA